MSAQALMDGNHSLNRLLHQLRGDSPYAQECVRKSNDSKIPHVGVSRQTQQHAHFRKSNPP